MKNRRLNLGCGPDWKKQYPDYVGLDIENYGQKYWINAVEFFKGINNGYLISGDEAMVNWDEVMANHFLEHLSQDQLKVVLSGIWKILKVGGVFKIVVPHKDKDDAWDLTHKTFWNERTIQRLEETEMFGKWKIEKLVVNERLDIHAWLIKI